MDSNFTNKNDPWEYSLDIDDSNLHLTPVLRSSSSPHVEPSPYTPNPVTIIPGPAGVIQLSNSIKAKIRPKNLQLSDNQLRKEHQSRLSLIDVKMDQGTATREDLNCRVSLMKILGDIERKEVSGLAQKSKIKWAIEGDENSSFFHGSLKKKRRQIAIKGVIKNGVRIEEPREISLEQRESLESDFTNDEIKRAVWDCGGDSSPGSDGFTFKFFKTFWETIQSDVVRFVREFAQTAYFPKGCNSAFIALIPKVGNAKFVSELRPISLIGCQYKIVGLKEVAQLMGEHSYQDMSFEQLAA
ncbi:hypothetical protein Tco_1133514 [Tanacetum coccineum]